MSQSLNGLLLIDKPAGLTSAAAVNRVKRVLPRGTKIGHAGTLDPFATGLLILLIGKATRRCEELMGAPKTYETTIKLGATTATDDPEAPEEPFFGAGAPREAAVSPEDVDRALRSFVGLIQQVPPRFSAIKLQGRRACDRVRAGQSVTLRPRAVQVYEIATDAFEWPFLRARIVCGRGTYIRSIARDLGAALNVGGYLTQLRRTRIGKYGVDNAVALAAVDAAAVETHLVA
jgi:tRNA pseudouridine55 synthase